MTKTKAVEKRKPVGAVPQERATTIVGQLAENYGLAPEVFLKTLRDTVFVPSKKDPRPFSNEEMAAALVLAKEYDLNPFAKEIYLTRSRGKLLVIVPVDGWTKIVNRHDEYAGCEFSFEDDDEDRVFSCTCTMWRKDREHPIRVSEYYGECYRDSEPWNKWPRRMLRHKAFIQAARLAFSLTGIVDEDESERYLGVVEIDEKEAYQKYLASGGTESLEDVKEVTLNKIKAPEPDQAVATAEQESPPPDSENPEPAPGQVPFYLEEIRRALGRLSETKRTQALKELGEGWEKTTDVSVLVDTLEYVKGV